MLSKEHLGNKLEIYLLNDKDVQMNKQGYVSQLEEIFSETQYKVGLPMTSGRYIPLLENQKVYSIVYDKTGLFGFNGVVKARLQGSIPSIIVERLSGFEKVQRREFYRLELAIPFEFKFGNEEAGALKGVIRDLSGGGLRFVTNQSIQNEVSIICSIPIGESIVRCMGVILRSSPVDTGNYKYQYHVKFSKIQDGDRDKIIKFIFDEQRRVQRRGRD